MPHTSPAATAAMPAGLLELLRQIVVAATATNQGGADFVSSAKSFLESAWDGSMLSETKSGRKIPLSDAIQRSTLILDASLKEMLRTYPALRREQTGEHFLEDKFRKNCRMSFKVCVSVCEVHCAYSTKSMSFLSV